MVGGGSGVVPAASPACGKGSPAVFANVPKPFAIPQVVPTILADVVVRLVPLSARPEMNIFSSAALVFCTVAVYLTVAQIFVVVAGPGLVFAELGASEESTVTGFDVPEIDVLDMSPCPNAVIVSVMPGVAPKPRFSTPGVALKVQVAPGVVWTVLTGRSYGPVQVLVPESMERVPAGQRARVLGADPDL